MAGENTKGVEQPAGSLPESGSGDQKIMSRDDAAKALTNMGSEEVKTDVVADGDAKEAPDDAKDAPDEKGEESAKDEKSKDAEESEKPEEKGDDEAEGDKAEPDKVPYKRLAAEVGKRHEAEELAKAEKERADRLENEAARALGLHPSYVSKDEAQLIHQANELETREGFLFTNLDGFEASKEAKALGLPETMTAREVREEMVRVRKDAGRIVAKANDLYEQRLAQQVADMEAGRKARLAAEKAVPGNGAKKPAAAAVPLREGAGARPAATRTTLPSGAGAGSRPVTQPTATRGMNLERFKKAGGDREAALKELSEL